MKIAELFNIKKSLFSFEIFPPKRGTALLDSPESAQRLDETLSALVNLNPDYISVPYGAGGFLNQDEPTIKVAKRLKSKFNVEPMAHVTGIYSTKSDIDNFLEVLRQEDISNILALRGDANPERKPLDTFPYAVDLIKYISRENDFGISAACYPEGHINAMSLEQDILYLKEKVDTGAEHLISQLFFDNEYFYYFMDRVRAKGISVPVEAGIMPVVNKNQIERMISLCGAKLPTKFRRILDKFGDNQEALQDAGIAYAVDQIVDLIAQGVQGIHLYTMNNPIIANKISDSIKSIRTGM